ncbi:MAG TPA: YCF48-related protein [Thermodesulfobacteriota bacterium]|nr:YCF48-related protein [Thermodesulfobacteriota bacterium]
MDGKEKRENAVWAARHRGKSLILSLVMSILAGSMSFGSDTMGGCEEAYTVTRRDKLFAVQFVDTKTGFAVGNKGMLLKTADRGVRWQKIACGPERIESFNAVSFSGSSGWVVGGNGLVLFTNDTGGTWQTQQSGTTETLIAVGALSATEAIAVGSAGTILSTADSGTTWKPADLDWMSILPEEVIARGITSPNLYDVFFADAEHGWVVGDSGLVLGTADGGRSWKLLAMGTYPTLYSVWFRSAAEGYVCGQEACLLHTTDGGTTWEKLSVPPQAANVPLYRVRFNGPSGLIAGDRALILTSADEGASWQVLSAELPPPLPWFADLCIVSHNSPSQAIIVGQSLIKSISVPGK